MHKIEELVVGGSVNNGATSSIWGIIVFFVKKIYIVIATIYRV